jgi:hypothetical protein
MAWLAPQTSSRCRAAIRSKGQLRTDGAVRVVVGPVAAGGQCLPDRGQDLVLVALGHGPGRRFGSQVGAEGGGGAVEGGRGGAGGIGLDGAGEELGQGGVVAGGQAELDLAVGADVVLGRAAGAGPPGGLVAADGDATLGHMTVQGATQGIAQPGEAGELPINVGEVHVAILKQMILDIYPPNFYNKGSFSIEEAA